MTTANPDCLGNTQSVVTVSSAVVGVGWLTVTFDSRKWESRKSLVETLLYVYTNHFHDCVVQTEVKARTYLDGYKTAAGTLLLFSPRRDDVCLSISQTAIEKISMADLVAFMYDISCCSPNVSRIDFYIDDYVGHMSNDTVRTAIDYGYYVGRATRVSEVSEQATRSGERSAETIYIGSRQSDCFIRFYNKALESGVKRIWNRCEMELKGPLAKRAAKLFLDAAALDYDPEFHGFSIDKDAIVKTIKGIILSKCDFRIPDTNANITRRKRAVFWEEIIMNAADIPKIQSNNAADIERLKQWFEAAVAPSLSLLLDYHGEDAEQWLTEMVLLGRERRKPRHTEMLIKARE